MEFLKSGVHLGDCFGDITSFWCPSIAELEFLGSISILRENLQINRIYIEIDNKFLVSFMAQHKRSNLDISCRKYSM